MSRYTYFAKCPMSQLIKIGRSSNPVERLKQFKPHPIVFAMVDSTELPEKKAHALFSTLRTFGEWFATDEETVIELLDLLGVTHIIPAPRAPRVAVNGLPVTARLSPELELRCTLAAKALQLTASDLVRIGLIRILDEYQETGSIEIRPSVETQEVAP